MINVRLPTTGSTPQSPRDYTGAVCGRHCLSRSHYPVLRCRRADERIYNLEFMPSRMNSRNGSAIGLRQRQLAEKWKLLGLLSDAGLRAVK